MNSWWWTEELLETFRVSYQNKFLKLVHLICFIIKKLTNGVSYRIIFNIAQRKINCFVTEKETAYCVEWAESSDIIQANFRIWTLMKHIIKFPIPCLCYLMIWEKIQDLMGRFFYGKHRILSDFFSFAVFGVQEILNRMFHNYLKGANLHENFVLLSDFSR